MQRIFLVVKVHDLVAIQRRDAGRAKHEIFKKINKKTSPRWKCRETFFFREPRYGGIPISELQEILFYLETIPRRF